MATPTPSETSKALPFHNFKSHHIIKMFQTEKSKLFEKLESNNFYKSMLEHENGLSKDNYTCSYYQENSIQNLLKKHLPDGLKIFHLNIASFNKNGIHLSFYLRFLSITFDIICLTEIGHSSIGIIEKQFPVHHIFIDPTLTSKGGVALLFRENIFDNVSEMEPINLKCNCKECQVENKWVTCKVNDQKFIVGGIYRHPNGNCEHFNTALNDVIRKIKDNNIAITLGDINIDLVNDDKENTSTYLNNYFSKNFLPCITIPTRITDHSATIIDHIFLKIPPKLIQNKCSSGCLITDISDHLPTFTFLDLEIPKVKKRPFIRLFTAKNKKLFAEKLPTEAPLINDCDLTDPDCAYDIFSENYSTLYNKFFPYVRMSRKASKDKPHITSDITLVLDICKD